MKNRDVEVKDYEGDSVMSLLLSRYAPTVNMAN